MEATSSPLSPILTQDKLKKIAAYKAVDFVQSDMVLCLGTDSIAKHTVDHITHLLHLRKLKNIFGIPTSKKTHQQAVSLGGGKVYGGGGWQLRDLLSLFFSLIFNKKILVLFCNCVILAGTNSFIFSSERGAGSCFSGGSSNGCGGRGGSGS